jgi:hypothetical protein
MPGALVPENANRPTIQATADNRRWYAVCGARVYSVATLAGLFPDTGFHQPGEMGGVWAPPLKLLDGYWLAVRTNESAPCWLTSPVTWQVDQDGVTLSYALLELGVMVERREWVIPDQPVLVVDVSLQRQFEASWKGAQSIAFGFLARSDLHGAWLSERLGWGDGDDVAEYDERLEAITFRDGRNAWEVCVGATQPPVDCQLGKDVWGPERTSGKGAGAALWYTCQITSEQPAHLRLLIVGASCPELRAGELFAQLARADTVASSASEAGEATLPAHGLLEQARQRARDHFLSPFSQCVLESPDARLNEVFAWAKASSALLTLEVPGLGRGVMGGLPDFPWWFGCDIAYGVLPMLPAGQGEAAADSLRLLAKMSRGNGAVPHEVVSNGVVFHPGNLVEIPLFARALYHTYRWTGDRHLLEDLFPFCLQGVEQQALGAALQAGEEVPNGTSIIETPEMAAGLQTLDVAAYLVEALDLLAELAGDLERADLARQLHERASSLRQHVRRAWWLPDKQLFGDVRASQAELQAILKRFEAQPAPDASLLASIALLRRALMEGQSEGRPEERRPWLLRHMVQALAADAGLPDREQAAYLLGQLETPEWLEAFGLVLNAANNRQVMTLPTGALAVGEARYGRVDAALAVMQRMARSFGAAMPGMLSEYAPDGGCFLQLWSNYGIIWPVIHAFFGLRPDAAKRRVICAPHLPSSWPRARLSALHLGDMQAEIELTALPDGVRACFETTDPRWVVTLGAVVPAGAQVISASLNGQPVVLTPSVLGQDEGRDTWLAPAQQGASSYELSVFWSKAAQFTTVAREGKDHQ